MDRQLSFHGDESGVIATNDDASESKRSCVKLNYYKDEYLGNFVKISEKKAPEINRGYYARVKGIEICVEKFLKVSSRPSEISISFDRDLFFVMQNFLSHLARKSTPTENGREVSNYQPRMWIRHAVLATPRCGPLAAELHRARLPDRHRQKVLSDKEEQSVAGQDPRRR